MTKTLIDIPDELMQAARDVLGSDVTKAETVRTALQELVQRRRQAVAVEFFARDDVLVDLADPAVRAAAWHA